MALLNGHEFGQIPGDAEGWGNLMCCIPWGRKGLDTTERLNRTETIAALLIGHTPIQNKKFF